MQTNSINPRTGAIVAAFSLLIVTILSAVSNTIAIGALRSGLDTQATADNLIELQGTFRLGALILIISALLNIIVAWGLQVTFSRTKRSLSNLGSWFRIALAVFQISLINNLFMAQQSAVSDSAVMQLLLESFDSGKIIALVIFSIHLMIVSILVWSNRSFSRVISLILFIAGAAYLSEGVFKLMFENLSLVPANLYFIGDIILILWLIVEGGSVPLRKEKIED